MSHPPHYPDGSDPNDDLPGYGTMPAGNPPNPPNPGMPSGPNPFPPGGFPPQPGAYPHAPTPQPANQSALWSMILGIVSIPLMCMCGLGAVAGIAAIVLGIIAKGQITQSGAIQPNAAQAGAGQALAGIICGSIATAFSLLYLVFFGIGMFGGF